MWSAGEGFYFGAPQWAVPAAALGAAALVALLWSYWAWRRGGAVRAAAALAKVVGFGLLAFCLLEPLYSSVRPRPGANLFLVAADNSKSLDIRDPQARLTRGETLQAQLDRETPWQTRLSQDFEVRRYAFDARLQAVDDFAGMTYDGAASSLGGSLSALATRYRQRPVAGMLVFTDGNASDWGGEPPSDAKLAEWPPIYPVVIGESEVERDLQIRRLTVSESDFEAAPVSIAIEIDSTGYAGEKLLVELLDEEGRAIDRQTVTAPEATGKDGADQTPPPLAVRFQTRPSVAGVSFYRARVASADEKNVFDEPAKTAEATLDNNRRLAMVDRAAGPYRVLYVSGRPNWEFKFLRRSLEGDAEIELAGLVRIAKREPKFDFRGHSGESTNPLFRGFGNEGDEEAQRYDQPVLLRVGVLADDQELRSGFPKTAETLYGFHAVILDDLEAGFFTPDQLSLLREFVSVRGGGLLMLAGPDSFQDGGYRRTPLDDLLPVYLESRDPSDSTTGETFGDDLSWRLSLTREGWLQPWVRVRATEEEERKRLAAMPSFETVQRLGAVKPGAMPLASVAPEDSELAGEFAGESSELAALVAQRFGDGRAAALAVGDMWRWGIRREEGQTADMEIAWRQLVRWLVNDAPRRVEIEAQPDATSSAGAKRVVVRVRDEEFAPLDNALVSLQVTTPAKERLELSATQSETEPGLYESLFSPRQEGAYRVEAIVRGPDGAEIGSRETGWAFEPAADEFKQLAPNRRLLERIAAETGGEVIELDRLDPFVASLNSRKAPVTEHWSQPLWHRPWVLLAAIACLCAEWALRRWRGMP